MCEKGNTSDDNDEESSDAPSSVIKSDSDETGKEEANITPTLSMSAMICISQPQTLSGFGHIKNTKVTMLVDNGITHKFTDSRVLK